MSQKDFLVGYPSKKLGFFDDGRDAYVYYSRFENNKFKNRSKKLALDKNYQAQLKPIISYAPNVYLTKTPRGFIDDQLDRLERLE